MSLATLSINLEARLAEFAEGMNKATRITEKTAAQIQSKFDGLANVGKSLGVALAGAFSVVTLERFVLGTIDGIDRLNDLKDATGASIGNISALEDIALRTGTSFESMAGTLVKFNKVLADAKPNSEAAGVLKAFNVDAEQLRKLDPAEALRQTAVAMARYADDGEKARAVQVLFGKSVQEVAPFLKDLAEQGRLNATVTTEQAEAAEKFNRQLSAMEKSATDLSRVLVERLTPAVVEMNTELSKGLKAYASFWEAVTDIGLQVDPFSSINENLANTVSQIARFRDELAKLNERQAEGGVLATVLAKSDKERLALIRDQLRLLEAREKFLRSLQYDGGPGAGRGLAVPGLPGVKLPPPPGVVGKAVKDATLSAEQIARLWEEERAREAENMSWWGKRINDEQIALAKQREDEEDRIAKERLDAFVLQAKQVAEFDEQSRERFEEQERIAARVDERIIEISTMVEQAARNIQDTLGDTVLQTLEGDFDSIGDLWGNLLKKMASQAIAAQLGKYLLGDFGSTVNGSTVTKVGGALGSLLDLLPSYDVGTPFVPHDMLAKVHKGERIVTAADNRAGRWSGGGGVVINQTNHIGAGVSYNGVMAAMYASTQAAVATIEDRMVRGRYRYV